MALNKQVLEQAIKAAFDKQAAKSGVNDDPVVSRNELAKSLADAFDAFVKSGTVSTTVTGTSPSGAVSGAGTGSIT